MNQDLSTLDTIAASNKGTEIELLSPKDQSKLGVFITVLGKDSDVFREALRENVNAANRRAFVARTRGKQVAPTTVEESEKESTDLLVACTIGWRTEATNDKGKPDAAKSGPFITFEGKQLEYTVPNARLLYDRLPWIKKQVDEAVADMELFMKS